MTSNGIYNNSGLKVNRTDSPGKPQTNKQVPDEGFANEFRKKLDSINPSGIEFSGHAVKRMEERNIDMTGDEMAKLQEAMGKLKTKGSKNSLVISENGAYIVDVKNNKVVTAIDRENIQENVFTKIDSTVVIN